MVIVRKKRRDILTEALEPCVHQEQRRPEDQDETADTHREKHVESTEYLNTTVDTRYGGRYIDRAEDHQDDNLGTERIRQTEEDVGTVGDLSREKADRPFRQRPRSRRLNRQSRRTPPS